MSDARVCDQCGEVLVVDANGSARNGEDAAWMTLETTFLNVDLCSRSCVVAFVESEQFVLAYDGGQEAVAEIVRRINGCEDEAEADDDGSDP